MAVSVRQGALDRITRSTAKQRGRRPEGELDCQPRASSLVVLSGKGGTGKSTLAALLASILGRSGRTLLVDADLGMGNAHLYLGVSPRCQVEEAFGYPGQERDFVHPIHEQLDLLPASSGSARHLDAVRAASQLGAVLMALEPGYQRLIVDGAPGMGPVLLAREADLSLLVTTPGVAALTDAYALLKSLWAMDESLRVLLVVNRARDREEGNQASRRLRQVVSRFLGRDLPCAAVLLEDPAARAAVESREALLTYDCDAPLVQSVQLLAHQIQEEWGHLYARGLGRGLARERTPA